jgi:hypothetical protein
MVALGLYLVYSEVYIHLTIDAYVYHCYTSERLVVL